MKHHRLPFGGLLLAAIVLGCAGPAGPAAEPPVSREAQRAPLGVCASQTPPPTPTPRPSPGAIVAKLPIHGLIDLGQVSADSMPEPPYNTLYYACKRGAALAGIVVNDTWAALQRHRGDRLDTKPIDAALAAVRAYNASSGHSLAVRLRIWAGIDAPNWAKAIGGPIVICDGNAVPTPSPSPDSARAAASPTPCPSVAERTTGAFWSPAYEQAWRDVQRQLAKKYDGDLAVSEVTVSSCSSLTSEPFVQPEDTFSKAALHAAGYSDKRYQACLKNAIARDYEPFWHLTWIPYSFNPFREIDVAPPVSDLAFTESVINGCRAAIGARCVLLNETLAKFTPPSPAPSQSPSVPLTYYAMWAYMQEQGGDITFQTASPPNLLNAWGANRAGWNAAVQLAHRFGASSLELFPPERYQPCTTPTRAWFDGYTCFTVKAMLRWKSGL